MITKEYIGYLLIILTGFTIGLINFRKSNGLKAIIILLGITFLSECCSRILAYEIKNSNPPYHFLTPLQCLLWGSFFYSEFDNKWKKKVSIFVSISSIFFSISNTIFFQNLLVFPSNALTIQSFVFITLGFMLFSQKLDESSEKNILKDPGFILSASVIWFNLISFVFINFHNFLLNKIMLASTMRLINYVSNYGYYLLILTAIIFIEKKKYLIQNGD